MRNQDWGQHRFGAPPRRKDWRCLQERSAIGMSGRQRVEVVAQVDQHLARNPLAATLNHRPEPEPDTARPIPN